MTSSVTIPVDQGTATAFADATPIQRERYERLMAFELWRLTRGDRPTRELGDIMDETAAHAAANGLTEEILEELLNDES